LGGGIEKTGCSNGLQVFDWVPYSGMPCFRTVDVSIGFRARMFVQKDPQNCLIYQSKEAIGIHSVAVRMKLKDSRRKISRRGFNDDAVSY
jgi:hypothetical protein